MTRVHPVTERNQYQITSHCRYFVLQVLDSPPRVRSRIWPVDPCPCPANEGTLETANDSQVIVNNCTCRTPTASASPRQNTAVKGSSRKPSLRDHCSIVIPATSITAQILTTLDYYSVWRGRLAERAAKCRDLVHLYVTLQPAMSTRAWLLCTLSCGPYRGHKLLSKCALSENARHSRR